MQQVVVEKGKTVIVSISLGFDVSQELFLSEIRATTSPTSTLIATWAISFEDDGKDGELLATLDDSVTSAITQSLGYMNLKCVTDVPAISLFDEPLEVLLTV